ncbi:surface lipoprotein assembly modifier [Profundibacter sp.]
MGHPRDGRRAAARAFRYSENDLDKFSSSQLAARLSYEEKRFTLAQYWLRRSVNFVQSPQHRQQVANDYRRLRAENPWNTQLRFSVAPSSNVNAGSDSNLSIIEGVPVVGLLSRSAQALSGISAVADVTTAFRFSKNANHAAYLTGRVYSRQIRLSSAAARAVPGVRNRDFSATAVELGVRYVFRAKKHDGLSTVRAIIGKNWYGGDPSSTFSRLGFEHSLRAAKRTRLTFSGSYERRDYERVGRAPAYIARFSANARHRFEGGSALQLGVFANNTTSTWVNTSSKSATAYVSYDMGKPVGPARFTFGIGATYQDYPNYRVGFIVVPGGRQDSVVFANVSATFDKLDYAGFVPKLTLRAQKNASNVSRFDTTQVSVTLGIQSSF